MITKPLKHEFGSGVSVVSISLDTNGVATSITVRGITFQLADREDRVALAKAIHTPDRLLLAALRLQSEPSFPLQQISDTLLRGG